MIFEMGTNLKRGTLLKNDIPLLLCFMSKIPNRNR